MTQSQAPQQTAVILLQAALAYFRTHHINHITAFDSDTGYPCLLAGRGFIPGNRIDLLSALGESGFSMQDRWLMYEKSLSAHLTEQLPDVKRLSLRIIVERHRRIFHVSQRSEHVATMIVENLPDLTEHTDLPTASVRELNVEAPFRHKGIATWLMLRAMNTLVSENMRRMIVHLNHRHGVAQSLLLKLAFTELPLRGYTYTFEPPS